MMEEHLEISTFAICEQQVERRPRILWIGTYTGSQYTKNDIIRSITRIFNPEQTPGIMALIV